MDIMELAGGAKGIFCSRLDDLKVIDIAINRLQEFDLIMGLICILILNKKYVIRHRIESVDMIK